MQHRDKPRDCLPHKCFEFSVLLFRFPVLWHCIEDGLRNRFPLFGIRVSQLVMNLMHEFCETFGDLIAINIIHGIGAQYKKTCECQSPVEIFISESESESECDIVCAVYLFASWTNRGFVFVEIAL